MAELLRFAGLDVEATTQLGSNATARVRLGAVAYEVSRIEREGSTLAFEYDGKRYRFDVLAGQRSVVVDDGVACCSAARVEPGEEDGGARAGGDLVSKMPGKVMQLLVPPGTHVLAGVPLLILEAMKMEHQVTAPVEGTVTGYLVDEGQRVMPGDLLVDFAPASL